MGYPKGPKQGTPLPDIQSSGVFPTNLGLFPPGQEVFDPEMPKMTPRPLVSARSTLGEHTQSRDQKRRSDLAPPDFARNDQRGGKAAHGKQREGFGVDTIGEGPTEFQPLGHTWSAEGER